MTSTLYRTPNNWPGYTLSVPKFVYFQEIKYIVSSLYVLSYTKTVLAAAMKNLADFPHVEHGVPKQQAYKLELQLGKLWMKRYK